MADPVPPSPPPAPRTETMYGRDGKPVQVPMGDVGARVRDGSLTFAKGQTVHVTDPSTGAIVPMPGDQAMKVLSTIEGAVTNVAHGQDFAEQEEAKSFDTVGQGVAAAGLGLARSATVGGSDYVATKVGGEGTRKYIQKQQKYNPIASAGGEVAGMILPALLTGGATAEASALAKAGRAGTALSRGVTAGAETGGRLVERGLVGLGAEEGGRLAGAGRILAQNAIEGGAQGIGQAISDASIKGDPLELEKIVAHGGRAALLGGALGGGLHGTLAVGKAGVGKVAGAVKEGVTDAFGNAREKLVNKIAGAIEGDAAAAGARAEGAVASELERAPHLGKFDPGIEGEAKGIAGAGGRERGGPRLKDDPSIREGNPATGNRVPPAEGEGLPGFEEAKSRVRAFLGAATKGDVEAMEKLGGEFLIRRSAEKMGIGLEGKGHVELAHEIADRLHVNSLTGTSVKAQKNLERLTKDARSAMPGMVEEELRAVAGLEKGAIMSREEMAAAAPLLKKEAGKDMEHVLAMFDKEAAGDATKLPSMSSAKERIEREIYEPMLAEVRVIKGDKVLWKDGGERARIVDAMRKQTEAFEGTTSFAQMHRDRRFFDEGINFAATSKADVMKSKAFRSARNIMEEELAAAGDRAAGTSGEAMLKWQGAKNRYAAAKVIEENAIIGAGLDAKNRVTGLSEQLGASRGAAIGTAAGAAVGSIVPVFGTAAGGLFGGLIGSALGSHAASIERRVGGQYAARVARQVSDEGVLRAGMKEVDMAMDSKLGTYFGEKGIQGAAAAKNKIQELLEKAGVEGGQATAKAAEAGAKVDKAAERAADAAERTATRAEEKIAGQVSKLEAEVEKAAPGQVRRALVEKLAGIKEAGAARVAAIREKAAELGEKAGRVRKALPGAPTIALEAERVKGRMTAANEETYEKKRQQYADLAQTPARLDQATAAIRVGRPDLANGLGAKLAEITAYVNAQAPASASFALTPGAGKDMPPPSEQARFLAIARAAEDPMSVLDDLEKGTLTSEQMQVVKDLYPALHAEIAQRVISRLADRKEPLPYSKRLQVGIFLGVPTDPSLEPDFIAATQASLATPAPAPPPAGALGKRKPTSVTAATSKMSALESGALE